MLAPRRKIRLVILFTISIFLLLILSISRGRSINKVPTPAKASKFDSADDLSLISSRQTEIQHSRPSTKTTNATPQELVLIEVQLDGTVPYKQVKEWMLNLGAALEAEVPQYRHGMLSFWIDQLQYKTVCSSPGIVSCSESQPPTFSEATYGNEPIVIPHHAAEVMKRYDGRGLTVAVMSSSFNLQNGYAADTANGYLPGPGNPKGYATPVIVVDEKSDILNGNDEGRAMLQLVHSIAPAATLCFASAAGSSTYFAMNVLKLMGPPCNADIIVEDYNSYDNPYEDGVAEWAIDTVSNDTNNVLFFSAVGNRNNFVKEVGRTHFVAASDSTVPEVLRDVGPSIASWHQFSPEWSSTPFFIPFNVRRRIGMYLYWNQPSLGTWDNLDLFIFNSTFDLVRPGRSTANRAVEYLFIEASSDEVQVMYLAVGKRVPSGTSPVPPDDSRPELEITLSATLSFLGSIWSGPNPSIPVTNTLIGQSGARRAFSVGSYKYWDTSAPNKYSSIGPTKRFWDSNGDLISLTGETRSKPDVMAVDCTDTSFFPGVDIEGNGFPNFCGTSAAAPKAAAFAALIQHASLRATGQKLTYKQVHEVFRMTSSNNGSYSRDIGYGLIDANEAVLYTESH
mmetsp:Transcript_40768/g.66107  ORF Transcript_40768/g.66107 Transcript_40768/m.66107 type:complete len:622 (-) Transcript_40768:276-2141(-)